MCQVSPSSKSCGSSFSENRDGLNILGTEKVLFIDLFLNVCRFNLGYCVHLLKNWRDGAKWKCKKKLAEEILIFWRNSPSHTVQITRASVSSCSFELLPDLHYLQDLIPLHH